MEKHSKHPLSHTGTSNNIKKQKTDKADTCVYAYCPVPNCYKQWYMKHTPSLRDEIIPLLSNGTIDLDAVWPRRCRNMISAIRVHFEEYHPDEELPYAVRRKRFKRTTEECHADAVVSDQSQHS